MADAERFDELAAGLQPHNTDAEQSVLGGMLLDSNTIPTVLEYLKPESFYLEAHRGLFSVIWQMFLSAEPVDFVTVCDKAVKAGVFQSPEETKAYLAQLLELTPTTANIENYCKIVQEKYYLRTLRGVASQLLTDVDENSADAATLLDAAEQRIFDIRQGRDVGGLVRIDKVILEAYDRLSLLAGENREEHLGLPTGYPLLDHIITGLNKTDLILIAARPGMGKTSFALNIAENVATKRDKQVAVFSFEMGREQLVTRLLSAEALIDSHNLRVGQLDTDEWQRLALGADHLSRAQLYLDDTPNLSVAEMKSRLRRMNNLGLVVIDYLQLMGSGNYSNRVNEVSEITRNLKIMAKELQVPVVTLSQLNRGPEGRPDHRPMMADLRESGSIEQDADIILFLYRDSKYDEDADPNEAECIVAKNRHGETGTVPLYWDGAHTRFLPVDNQHEQP